MSTHMDVEPVEGATLPMEGAPKRYIRKRTKVPCTAYYLRAVARGDLKRTGVKMAKPSKSKSDKEG